MPVLAVAAKLHLAWRLWLSRPAMTETYSHDMHPHMCHLARGGKRSSPAAQRDVYKCSRASGREGRRRSEDVQSRGLHGADESRCEALWGAQMRDGACRMDWIGRFIQATLILHGSQTLRIVVMRGLGVYGQ